MKYAIALLFILAFISNSNAQCEKYCRYHTPDLILPSGDTLNKVDAYGYYNGMHVYSENDTFMDRDTVAWMKGKYDHGLPVDKWVIHCKNGDYSTGYFDAGRIEVFQKGSLTNYRMEGLNGKIGIWKYYNKDSLLIKTLKFKKTTSRNRESDKIYMQKKDGRFILVQFKYFKTKPVDGYRGAAKSKILIERQYSDSGILLLSVTNNFWKQQTSVFYPSGKLRSRFTCRKILGIPTNRFVSLQYDEKGKCTDRTKTHCRPGVK